MKKRLLFLFFLVNVLFTSLARCAKRSNRKRSRKSNLRKDLRQIKKDVAELKDDHERMLVMMESMNKNVLEIGSGFGSSEEYQIPEGYHLVDDMVVPCSSLDWDGFYEYEIPIPPSCKEELREKSKKKGRKGSKRKVKNKKGKKTKGKKIKGKKTKSKKERQKN